MGQSSSQIDPFKDPESCDEQVARPEKSKHKGHHKKKSKKRSEGSLQSVDREEESARALLQLREDAVHNSRISPFDEDNFAASAQLWAESSPAHPARSYDIEKRINGDLGKSNSHAQDDQRRRKQRRMRKHEEVEVSQQGSEQSSIVIHQDDGRPFKKVKLTQPTNGLSGGFGLNRSTFSLDDIPSDDETIAAFFKEYEDELTTVASQDLTQTEVIGSESQMQRLAATVDRDEPDPSFNPTYHLLSRSATPCHDCGKNKGKRKFRSDSTLGTNEASNGEQMEVDSALDRNEDDFHKQMDDTGQPAYALDFEAFDAFVKNQQGEFANLSHQSQTYDFPLDPDLVQDKQTQAPEGDGAVVEVNDFSLDQPSTNGNLKRVYSSSRKRRRTEERSHDDSFEPSNEPSPNLSQDLAINPEDQVLPGNEDSQHPSPEETTSSRPASAESILSSRSLSEIQREKTPPAIPKRSKPRGNKTQQGGKKGKNYDPPLKQIAQKGGMFKDSEVSKLDDLRDRYCRANNLTTWQFNQMIQSNVRMNRAAKELWDEIHEITPYRTRMSTMRFCRRRYHNFSARGTWTHSEDESLKHAVAVKGKSWKAVGEMIDRFPEDCRDRYRNYHVNAEHRNREQWTESEVRNLCSAVYDCMLLMKEERKQARAERFHGRDIPDSEPESDEEIRELKLINWQAVSDRMGHSGGGRSRLQCSFKWGKLKTADRDKYLKEVEAAIRGKRQAQNGKRKRTSPWRLARALRKLRNLKAGDRYDFLQALSTCGATQEDKIPWRALGDEGFRARWPTIERKAAWVKFKAEVPNAKNMDYRDVINRLLTQLMAENMDKLEERWDPNRDGDVNLVKRKRRLTEQEKQEREKLRRQARERKFNYKSQEFIKSSDEDEESGRPGDFPAHMESAAEPREPSRTSTSPALGGANGEGPRDEGPQDADPGAESNSSLGTDVEIGDSDDDLFLDMDGNVNADLTSHIESLRGA